MECLIPFGTEYFVFQFVIQKYKNKMYRTITVPVILYWRETWCGRIRGWGCWRKGSGKTCIVKWDEVTGV
jgi:hypothetical protein